LRKSGKAVGSALTLALLTVPFAPVASAAPPAEGAAVAVEKSHDRPDQLSDERRALKQKAVELVATGERKVEDRGGSKAVRIAPGQYAQYGVEESDRLLTFLVEFGGTKDPRFPAAPGAQSHNEIVEPKAGDNSTYWVEDFSRDHYQDMFFGEGESFAGVYEELSSGRYTVTGDTSDWVTVPNNQASYGETENSTDMTRFIDDSAEAWLAAEKAKGKTDAEIKAYLQSFDEWDRYDFDDDGDFSEADGYIDHFQAVHAGEDESAGAPSWALWAHRWAVNQRGTYKDGAGPANAKFGGIQIGDTGLWIRDYTTEPENGGLGVFAHEYAHDLGLPDLYDTSGGENGTGFWTLMSSGSWLGHGDGAIGTTPNHMGAWEKLQLGWLDAVTVKAGTKTTVNLGPAAHATKKGQALVVQLPTDANGKNRFYIAENRQYLGLDTTLQQGPYNFGWGTSSPDRVEHFPYQNGLLISYWNTARTRNTVRTHPGEGLVLPVDARPAALTWSDGVVARNRIQTFDATFGTEATDAISLHRETATGMTTLEVPSSKAVPVFDDTNPTAYYDATNPLGSVKVAGTGTKIKVVQSNSQGMMTVQVQ
jgi:M6 family metalloprotease-like protein